MANDINFYTSINNFPKQRLPLKKKTQKWREDCVDAAIGRAGRWETGRRASRKNMQRNYDFFNGKINRADFDHVTDPYNIKSENFQFPASLQPYDIVSPIFNLLMGEESARMFNPIVVLANPTAISEKEQQESQHYANITMQASKMFAEGADQSEVEKFMQQQMLTPFQDRREIMGNNVLKHYMRELHGDRIFQEGWKDLLLAGEEIYKTEIVGGKLSFRRCNPKKVTYLLPPNVDDIDYAEVIVEDDYMSYSQIIDRFYEEFEDQPEILEKLENMAGYNRGSYPAGWSDTGSGLLNYDMPPTIYIEQIDSADDVAGDSLWDQDGNIKVFHVTWASYRQILEVSFVDEEGELQKVIVDESYPIQKNNNIAIRELWIKEYWEGWRAGDFLYWGIRPKAEQFRTVENPAMAKTGYVSTLHSAANSKNISLMDRIIPWAYLYIIIWYRTELLLAANIGKIALVDLALIPDTWEPAEWISMAKSMGFGFVNSFQQSNEGPSEGRLAGDTNQNKALDLETGNSIQFHLEVLQYIDQMIKQVSGVTDQRLGTIQQHERVGNTERSVVQSNHITELLFSQHNDTKLRVLENLIQLSKTALGDNPIKMQYVTGDGAAKIYEIDPIELQNCDLGLFVTNSNKDHSALQAAKELMHAAMQNEQVSILDVIDVYTNDSLADLKKNLRESMEKMQQQRMQEAQMAQETMMHEKEFEAQENQLDRESNERIALIKSFSFQRDQDLDDNGIPDQFEIEKLKQAAEEAEGKLDLEKRKIESDKQKHDDEMKVKEKELKIKEKEVEVKKIAAKKPAPKAK